LEPSARKTDRPSLCLVLHAHLPWVKRLDHARFLEESWLHEAVFECYLPLLRVLDGWKRDHIPAQICFSISPTLAGMLEDELLRQRRRARFRAWLDLAEREILRATFDPALRSLAEFQRERLWEALRQLDALEENPLSGFAQHQREGRVELITSSATHALLPLLTRHPRTLHAQIHLALREHLRRFASPASGFWLPECAWSPELEPILREAGIRWTILESSSTSNQVDSPSISVTPLGLVCWHRDASTAELVWSRESGYPGDPRYRDFYRDTGFDAERSYLEPALPCPERAGFTGFKYHAIRSESGNKQRYDRPAALKAVEEHGWHFIESLSRRARFQNEHAPCSPTFGPWICPYDAELFGHWWFEGPEFLDAVARHAFHHPQGPRLTTPSAALDFLAASSKRESRPSPPAWTPPASTWGEGGDLRAWIHPHNAWMRPRIESLQTRMEQASFLSAQPNLTATATDDSTVLIRRAWNQSVRELLLAQASDWPFQLRHDARSLFPRQQFERHAHACEVLLDQLENHSLDAAFLSRLEQEDSLFPYEPAQSFRNDSSSRTRTPSF